MADKKKGYVPIWRALQDHWIWKYKEPFDHRSAWIDLLLLVNHKEEKIPIGTRIQTIKPGQRWLSYKWLGNRWGWSYRKVLRFISQLVSDGMVYVDGTPNGTLLTVINWASFNGEGISHGITRGTTNGTTDGIPPVISDGTTDGIQTIMNNNDKECKRMKNKEEPAALPIEPPTGGGEWQ